MKSLNDFLKSIPLSIWITSLGCIVVICLLPLLFTRPGLLDFTETGQIGDTIGGTMGPFIAIVAAFLTFIAFWVQFDANQQLIKENQRNHFESRFYKMLDIHLNSVAVLNNRKTILAQDSIFHVWCDEIQELFKILNDSNSFDDFVTYLEKKNKQLKPDFMAFVKALQESREELEKVVYEISYSYFYNKNISTIYYGDDVTTEHLRKFAVLYTTYLQTHGKIQITITAKNELLGRYYRHLYQMVKYVNAQPDLLYDEKDWKKGFIGILRSQMSDYEQLLLYYNAQSSMGKDWDKESLIEQYKLIKNIPRTSIYYCAGISPARKYKEEIKRVESLGDHFFERN